MTQRNPMNARNQGEGPSGKTKKSAASAKPAKAAAGTVYVKNKPKTKRELRAIQEKERKEKEALVEKRRQKAEAEERKRLEKEAAARGETLPEPVKETPDEKKKREQRERKEAAKARRAQEAAERKARNSEHSLKDDIVDFFTGKKRKAAAEAETQRQVAELRAKEGKAGDVSKPVTPEEEAMAQAVLKRNAKTKKRADSYNTWKSIFYFLIVIAVIFIVYAFLVQRGTITSYQSTGSMIITSYVALAAAIVVDFVFLRPVRKMQQRGTATSRSLSAKEVKHLTERQHELDRREAEKLAKRARRMDSLKPGKKKDSEQDEPVFKVADDGAAEDAVTGEDAPKEMAESAVAEAPVAEATAADEGAESAVEASDTTATAAEVDAEVGGAVTVESATPDTATAVAVADEAARVDVPAVEDCAAIAPTPQVAQPQTETAADAEVVKDAAIAEGQEASEDIEK